MCFFLHNFTLSTLFNMQSITHPMHLFSSCQVEVHVDVSWSYRKHKIESQIKTLLLKHYSMLTMFLVSFFFSPPPLFFFVYTIYPSTLLEDVWRAHVRLVIQRGCNVHGVYVNCRCHNMHNYIYQCHWYSAEVQWLPWIIRTNDRDGGGGGGGGGD